MTEAQNARYRALLEMFDATGLHATFQPVDNVAGVEGVAEIAGSMRKHGWVGPPLVAWKNQLLTGTHRFYAAMRARTAVPVLRLDIHADELLGSDTATRLRMGADGAESAYGLYVFVRDLIADADSTLAESLGLEGS